MSAAAGLERRSARVDQPEEPPAHVFLDPDEPLDSVVVDEHLHQERWSLDREVQSEKRRLYAIIAAIVLILGGCIVALYAASPGRAAASSTPAEPPSRSSDHPQGSRYVCVWEWSAYQPSAWELQWKENIPAWRETVCAILDQQPHRDLSILATARVDRWQLADASPVHRHIHSPTIRASLAGGGAVAVKVAESTMPPDVPGDWSDQSLIVRSEETMSSQHYELRCRASGPKVDPATRADRPYHTVARGLQLIEPLIGLLRDPLTMCPPQSPGSTALINDILSKMTNTEPEQSKRIFLPIYSAPWAVDTAVLDADASMPVGLRTPEFRHAVAVAIESIGTATRLPPFAYGLPRAHSVAADSTLASGFLHPAYVPAPQSSHSLDLSGATPVWIRTSGDMTEEEAQTAIIVDIPTTAAAEDKKDADASASPTESSCHLTVPSAMLSRAGERTDWRTRASPRVFLFDFGARSVHSHACVRVNGISSGDLTRLWLFVRFVSSLRWCFPRSVRPFARSFCLRSLVVRSFSYFGGWDVTMSALGSQWFYHIIQRKGLAIDHVWAYEYEKLDPHKEWGQIPPELVPEFTWVNAGVVADKASAQNPWNTLLKVARPTDVVLVKLDIGQQTHRRTRARAWSEHRLPWHCTTLCLTCPLRLSLPRSRFLCWCADTAAIEVPLFLQALSEPAITRLIDEMYFEHHGQPRERERQDGRGSGTHACSLRC